jgi:hypothetical protein
MAHLVALITDLELAAELVAAAEAAGHYRRRMYRRAGYLGGMRGAH